MDVRPSHSAQLCSSGAKCRLCSSSTNQRPHLSGTSSHVLLWQNCNMACRETRFFNVVLTCLWRGLALLCVLYHYWLINGDLVPLWSFFKRQGRWNLYPEEWVARRTLHPSWACKKRRHRSMTLRPVREQAARALAGTNGAICSWGILSKCL